MKAIILAAGKGSRLGNLTKDKPKGMLDFFGKTILERQIELFRKCNINKIIIVTGYQSHCIQYNGVKLYKNNNFEASNMIESLMSARDEFNDDVIVSYSDILFSKNLLTNLINNENKICVSVDSEWKEYWLKRYGSLKEDLERLDISEEGKIIHIGSETQDATDLKFRYIGLNKFSEKSLKVITKIYDKKKDINENWNPSNNKFMQGYMTDLIQEVIDSGIAVYASINKHNWLEIDTENDYELATKLYKNKSFQLFNE